MLSNGAVRELSCTRMDWLKLLLRLEEDWFMRSHNSDSKGCVEGYTPGWIYWGGNSIVS